MNYLLIPTPTLADFNSYFQFTSLLCEILLNTIRTLVALILAALLKDIHFPLS